MNTKFEIQNSSKNDLRKWGDELNILYEKSFLYTNNVRTFEWIKDRLNMGVMRCESVGGDYFFYENRLLTYFTNSQNKLNLKPSILKLPNKKYILDQNKEFLKINEFEISDVFVQMVCKKEVGFAKNQHLIRYADASKKDEIYVFLKRYFDTDYILFVEDVQKALENKQVLICELDGRLAGVLVFSELLNYANIDFIAVDGDYLGKNVAFDLVNMFFEINKKFVLFKLFVHKNNARAIKFYKKMGFECTNNEFVYYKNFKFKEKKMREIKEFFVEINRDDVDESMEHMLSDGIIDSMDIMALVAAIEKYYKKPLNAKFIVSDSFESFENIKDMINKAMN